LRCCAAIELNQNAVKNPALNTGIASFSQPQFCTSLPAMSIKAIVIACKSRMPGMNFNVTFFLTLRYVFQL
jgi:hypothetical protein